MLPRKLERSIVPILEQHQLGMDDRAVLGDHRADPNSNVCLLPIYNLLYVCAGFRLRMGERSRLLPWNVERSIVPILEQYQLGVDDRAVLGDPNSIPDSSILLPAIHHLLHVRVGR